MKVKELEQYLSLAKPFASPKLSLEQYATDAHLAARLAYTGATVFDDFADRRVLDLGCGCGMLSLAACLVDSASVTSVDIDLEALEQFRENAVRVLDLEGPEEVEDHFEILQGDVLTMHQWYSGRHFDTVILNPPFGTKSNAGIDMAFLGVALTMLPPGGGAVYSMHKSSTREFILRKAKEEWRVKDVQVLAQMKFAIPHQFKFHKKERIFVEVDLIRLQR